MKQRKIMNKVLLLGVLVIWVFVLKRAFSIWGKESEGVRNLVENATPAKIPYFEKDTFKLLVLYRDPFLEYRSERKLKVTDKVTRPRVQKNTAPKVAKASKTQWPKLQYYGYLQADSRSEKMALIKIDGKLHRIREKTTVESIQVMKVYKDSVVLKRDGSRKVIAK